MNNNTGRQEMQLYDNTGGFFLAGIGGGILLILFLGLAGSGGVVLLGMELVGGNLQPLFTGEADAAKLAAAAAVVA